MNESMYNAHTLYKHTTRIDAEKLKEEKKSQEIINVPSYEFLYRARKKVTKKN